MALRMMSAIVPSCSAGTTIANSAAAAERTCCVSLADEESSAERDKRALARELLAAAKQCHRRFGGKAELATESEACVRELCSALERVLGHGLRVPRRARGAEAAGGEQLVAAALRHVSELVRKGPSANSSAETPPPPPPPPRNFWPCVREQLTWHERERFGVLRKVQSEQGRGRAWLRAALNERSLENHLHSVLAPGALEPYYQRWAFLRDQDKSAILPNVAAGLTTILFAMRVDNPELDCVSEQGSAVRSVAVEPIIDQPELPDAVPSAAAKLRKKVQTHIISFDDDTADADTRVAADQGAEQKISKLLENTSLVATSPAETKDVVVNCESLRWPPQDDKDNLEERLLTPLTDAQGTGSLMPVSPIDSTLDEVWANIPSNYLEKGNDEATEAAEEATEPFISTLTDADTSDADALKSRLAVLNEIVEQAREDAIASKLQLGRLQRQHQNYMEKHELQIQALNRENELLRQQLRKYVTAVQLLKENSAKEDSPDYHKESEEYQIKLVQVAEMHAELMEFNARLTMQLNNKDRLVKLLQTELECLRGPINEEDVPNKTPSLIHIWIPSAFLTGQTSDIHHVYQIYIRIRDTEWNIYRRYAQFYALYRELKKQDSVVTSFEFPPKKTIGNKDSRFVEDRRQKLQQWLRRIVNRLSHCSAAFSSNPTKQTLITLLPFFGDLPPNAESRRNHSSGNTCASSPQYMGL